MRRASTERECHHITIPIQRFFMNSRYGASSVIQLQRRHDLIPNLVNAVKGLSDHEKNVQTELAQMRAQLTATLPGSEAGISPPAPST